MKGVIAAAASANHRYAPPLRLHPTQRTAATERPSNSPNGTIPISEYQGNRHVGRKGLASNVGA
jgi:hypothetical protein